MITLTERLRHSPAQWREFRRKIMRQMRVAVPGIIQSFDAASQTVSVDIALREKLQIDGVTKDDEIPTLHHVPILLPRAGNYVLTMPVQKGDECLLVFSDMCMDAWWQSGGVQNQMRRRRHDLSDGVAILSCWSQPRKIPNYSMAGAQLRTLDGETFLEVIDGQVTVNKNLKVGSGASGSFTTQNGGVVTVADGIIIDIQ